MSEISKFVRQLLCEVSKQQNCPLSNDRYLVVLNAGQPKWVLPQYAVHSVSILKQWKPYSLSSMLKWQVLLLLYRCKLLHFFPGVVSVSVPQRRPSQQQGRIPVIYVGAPGVQRKAVTTWLTENGQPILVSKLALTEEASDSIENERQALLYLQQHHVPGVPSLFTDVNGTEGQEVLIGRPCSLELDQPLVNWLARLPQTGERKLIKSLCDEWADNLVRLSLDKRDVEFIGDVLKNYSEMEASFATIASHGDFAPWNIKRDRKNRVLVYDWEGFRKDNLPLFDICHFYCIQDFLLNKNKGLGPLKQSIWLVEYLELLSIPPSDKVTLIHLCLLSIVCSAEVFISEQYQKFLVQQLRQDIN